ncbi:MAG: type II secretion system protein [Colwellia sp.]|nr:type II secretion system protein [Colwellia sp.]
MSNSIFRQTKSNQGFTLIELMIVMSIIALVMSLVGPMTIQGYEKIQAKEEQMTLQNWMKGNSYRSFATSKPGVITLQQSSVVFRYQLNKVNQVNSSNTQNTSQYQYDAVSQEPSLSQEESPIISDLEFQFLTFTPQTFEVNTFGLIKPTTMTVLVNGKERTIDLGKRINGSNK